MLSRRAINCLALLALLLGGCAGSPPFDTAGVDRTLLPVRSSVESPDMTGRQVVWGGTIMNTVNLRDRTRVEVLAFPLDKRDKPQLDDPPLGRFIAEQDGFLDPAVYAPDRLISVTGTVTGIEPESSGGSRQGYPSVRAGTLYLWPRESRFDTSTIHFGLELSFGF